MKNYLKMFCIFFLSVGIFFSISLFALRIFFQETDNDKLIVLGPDNENVTIIPKDPGGKKISNLEIEILNNKKALISEEKIRPKQTKPELLPIEIKEETNKQNKKIENKFGSNLQDSTIIKPVLRPKKKYSTKKPIGMYRVQFGSFRDFKKAKAAMKSMNKNYTDLLSDFKLEIFTYETNNKVIFHRVWTNPVIKIQGLELCNKFKVKNILCILQVSK